MQKNHRAFKRQDYLSALSGSCSYVASDGCLAFFENAENVSICEKTRGDEEDDHQPRSCS